MSKSLAADFFCFTVIFPVKGWEEITEEHREVIDAIKVIFEAFNVKQTEGIAMTGDDEKVLNALEIIIDYMVKDSSIT
jgi:predicted RNA binding protein with dsRBD fold (UPF0201 family)